MRALRMVTRDKDFKRRRMGKSIEGRMEKIPSDAFLWAAGLSIAGSLVMKFIQRDNDAQFVGQWVPTLLILGLYNKMMKRHG